MRITHSLCTAQISEDGNQKMRHNYFLWYAFFARNGMYKYGAGKSQRSIWMSNVMYILNSEEALNRVCRYHSLIQYKFRNKTQAYSIDMYF